MYKAHKVHSGVCKAYARVFKCALECAECTKCAKCTLEVTKCTLEVTKFMLEGTKCALECAIVRILDAYDEEVILAEKVPNLSRVRY